MEGLLQDVRYSVRLLLKQRSTTIIAVLALALGIGANSAVFTVVDAALLRPLPFTQPERLVHISESKVQEQFNRREASYPDYLDWKQKSEIFEDVAGYTGPGSVTVTGSDEPERADSCAVTANFFSVLGVAPSIGRVLQKGDDVAGSEPAVVLSHDFWVRRFGGDASALGRSVVVNGKSFTIVGVLPASFQFAKIGPVEIYAAFVPPPFAQKRDRYFLNTVGRLGDGVTFEHARDAMHADGERLAREYPQSHAGVDIVMVPLRDDLVGNVKPILFALAGAVAFVLLIACSNVANLLLARSSSRRKEIAIRLALGASRWRVARQLLTESIVLACVGGLGGLLLGLWGTDALLSAVPEGLMRFMPYLRDAHVNGEALAFTLGLSLVTGIVFGLAPAVQLTKSDPQGSLKEGGRSGSAPSRSALRASLVVTEIGLALVLLVGAGLMLRSVVGLMRVDPGFKPENVLSIEIPLIGKKYSEPARVFAFYDGLRERVSALPGVQGVAAVDVLPIAGGGGNTGNFAIVGDQPSTPGDQPEANMRTVTANYFEVMSIPLIAGRGFTDRDVVDGPRVVVVNRALASRAFPNDDGIGRVLTLGFDSSQTKFEIVGIVGDEKVGRIDASATPVIYFPHIQDGTAAMSIVVRSTGDPTMLLAAVRASVADLDPNTAVGSTVALTDAIASAPATFLRRYPALIAGILAIVALILAIAGIYGVMSYSVAQRTHEIGVRVAIGASRAAIYRLVVGEGLLLALGGVGAGLLASVALTRYLSSFLFGVSPTDPAVFVTVSTSLVGVALLACFLPARRAARVDPVVALRCE